MRPTDLSLLRVPSDPSLSPDGDRVVVAVTRIDLDADAYRSGLWIAPTDGSSPPRPLTYGPRDTRPRWSPDGRWIAFLRAQEGGKPQLHVMPADGGEPRRVSEHPLGTEAPVWSPDSTRIAYVARVPEPGRYGTEDEDGRAYRGPERERPRRITTLRYRFDGIGFTADRRPHVFVVDALDHDASPVQITRGDFDHADPAWSPDGRWLAFVAGRHETHGQDERSDVFVAPAGGGDARQVTPTEAPRARPAFSPDGHTIYFLSTGTDDFAGRNTGLWSVPADGSSPPRRITEAEPWDLESLLATGLLPLLTGPDGVITIALNRGGVDLVRIPDSGEPERLLTGEQQVHGYDRAGDTIAAVVTTGVSAGELVVRRGDREQVISDFGGELARTVSLSQPRELYATAPDGGEVHGWVLRPEGTGPFPVVLMVHGGPHAFYGHVLFDEAQVLTGAGYAVVMGNPRGSAGYGEAHGRAAVGDLGHGPMGDLLALLDVALVDPDLDSGRVGVMGGSYGGYMTAWMAAHAGERFRAGICERAALGFETMYATSDIGWLFVTRYCGTDPEQIREISPLTHADGIDLPMLLIHSEQDWRCPIEQVQRLFVNLVERGVETELLLFPGEGHELTRSGLPSHRVERFGAVLQWWERHLGDQVAAVGTKRAVPSASP